MSKNTGYAQKERELWTERWRRFAHSFVGKLPPAHYTVEFKRPLEQTHEDILCHSIPKVYSLPSLCYEDEHLKVSARTIDMQRMSKHFKDNHVLLHSPQLIDLLTGQFSPHKAYTNIVSPSKFVELGKGEPLEAYNQFIGGVHYAQSAEWSCSHEDSLSKKAKDITHLLSKAVSQFPDNKPCIVHICYETLTGQVVEFLRQKRVNETLWDFHTGEKDVHWVILNAIQLTASVTEQFECAETSLSFGKNGEGSFVDIIPNELILDAESSSRSDATTHWIQDYLSS